MISLGWQCSISQSQERLRVHMQLLVLIRHGRFWFILRTILFCRFRFYAFDIILFTIDQIVSDEISQSHLITNAHGDVVLVILLNPLLSVCAYMMIKPFVQKIRRSLFSILRTSAFFDETLKTILIPILAHQARMDW